MPARLEHLTPRGGCPRRRFRRTSNDRRTRAAPKLLRHPASPAGNVGHQLVHCSYESGLEVKHTRMGSFAANGEMFRLAAEARRIRSATCSTPA